jgi:hypothetical protein
MAHPVPTPALVFLPLGRRETPLRGNAVRRPALLALAAAFTLSAGDTGRADPGAEAAAAPMAEAAPIVRRGSRPAGSITPPLITFSAADTGPLVRRGGRPAGSINPPLATLATTDAEPPLLPGR